MLLILNKYVEIRRVLDWAYHLRDERAYQGDVMC